MVRNMESLYESCCSLGKTAAHTIELSGPDKSVREETCASVLQLEISAPLQSADAEQHREFSRRFWCQRVKHLCCVSSRRTRACQVGSEHILKHHEHNCSAKAFRNLVESRFIGVAKECCLCQFVWTANRTNHKAWEELRAQAKVTACPGAGCCSLLHNVTNFQNIKAKDRATMSDDPDALLGKTTPPVPLPTESDDVPDDFEFSMGGGLNMPSMFPLNSEVTKVSTEMGRTTAAVPANAARVECAENFAWDADQELCVRVITACPIGMYLNKKTKKCVKRGSEAISCKSGFVFNETTDTCTDIDECRDGLPGGDKPCIGEGMICINHPGFYNCSCSEGFQMAEDGTCVDINECNLPKNPCRSGQQCRNIIGSYQCIRQVPCGFGYVLNPKTQQCEDVNECKADPNICGRGMMCINVRGGHKCVDQKCPGKARRDKFGNCVPCPTGYLFNATSNSCEDVDECSSADQCKPWERCVNQMGYFVCQQKLNCEHGTRINGNGTSCDDIDECSEKSFNCRHDEICKNKPGSYDCVPSPCSITQIYDYVNKTCTCEAGLRNVDGNCVDINECEETPFVCAVGEKCVNHIGGYRCVRMNECQPGFERDGPFGVCRDIDECRNGAAKCGPNMYCLNTIGSFQCLCERGYKNLDHETCVDVDECQVFGSQASCPDPRARCVNTNGSHICVCPEGFIWVDYPISKCKDIDECSQQPDRCGKEHRCVNVEGSYNCVCAPGYKATEDSKRCVDIDECQAHLYQSNSRNPCPHSLCVNTPGSYECRCPDGFRLGPGGRCYDIDECNDIPGVCKSKHAMGYSQACVNLVGGYRCVSNECPPSYTKSRLGNGFRCELDPAHACVPGDAACLAERPQMMDNLFIELDQDTGVPQILTRVDTRHLPSGVIRVDLRQHYANHLRTRNPVRVDQAFRLQRSRTQFGKVEVILVRPLPAPVDILISLHLIASKGDVQVGHSITKLYLFVTQSLNERVRNSLTSRVPAYRHTDFWTQLRHTN